MFVALLLACSTTPDAAAPTPAAATPEAAPAAPAPKLGEDVDPAAAIPVDRVVADADDWSGKPVTIQGTIKQVCQKKGCWHTIATADPAVDVMVKDKEYQIFLPFDAAGKTAVVKGTFSVEILPLDEARHYAEDAGKDPSTITEAPKTFLMDADGVRIL